MKMTIDNPDMLKVLPNFMKSDETVKALSAAMSKLFSDPGKKVKQIRKWDQIDSLSDAQLNEIAWEFNVDWWDSSLSIERKRAVIKTCYRILEKRGTKYAVNELITATFGYGEVTEWFEYGGEPYWFRITTDTILTEEGLNLFAALIDKVKSTRSWLEGVDKQLFLGLDTKVGHATCITKKLRIGAEEV